MSGRARKAFTGYHMAMILVGFFGIVIAVNIYMAKVAIGSFGGTVVENSYVASQEYNGWLAEADREAKLGWSVTAHRDAANSISLAITDQGAAGVGFVASATAEHPLGRLPARRLQFVADGAGRYLSTTSLPEGRWKLRIEIRRTGDRYRTMAEVQ